LVVDPKTREVHLLNATATRVWELLERPQTLDDLLGTLGREFEAPEETLRGDLTTLLAELGNKGLIDGNDWQKADR
ncbi:MAG TPA: PqqD family protein, partial [Polyangia bacterium]